MLSEVTGDLLDVAKRLGEINRDYRVFWNNRLMRYEVHTRALEFVVPYDKLDTRTLEYAFKTRRENADAIETEINEHNAAVEKAALQSLEHASIALEDMLTYANRASHPVLFTKNYLKEF